MTSIQDKIIKPKLELPELARQRGSVSQACNMMVISKTAFTGSRICTRMAVRKR